MRVQSVEPEIAPMHYQYDNRGRLQAVSQTADGQTRAVTFTYDQSQNGGPSSGRLTGITDSLNRTTTFAYDPNLSGRVIRQILPNGRFVQFLYDANGNLTGITPPSRPVHGYAYTPVDLVSDYIPPDVGAGNNFTHYAYNADGQLTRVVRPDGLTINLGYDFAGRLETLATPLGETTYFYDGPSCGCAGSDNPSAILTPDAIVLSYRYDGPLLTNTEWIGPVTGQVSRVFDNNWQLIEHRVNGVNPVHYGYDDDGLLTQACSLVLTRDPQNGFLAGTNLGNLHDSWQYNGYGERASYLAAYGATPVYAYSFLRDQAGQIVAKTETILGITDTYAYAYDALGQLTNVTKNGQPFSSYVYDENGNRVLDQRVTDSGPRTTVYEVDAQDRLLACYTPDATNRYAYTDNGELYAKTDATGTTQYTCDVLGNLRTVVLPTGTRIDYVIDGANRRIGKKVNGVLVKGFLYQNGLRPIAELDGNNQVVARFVYAVKINVPEYMIKGGAAWRLITDHLGSVRLVVNAATGGIAQQLDYDEFGNVLRDTHPGFQSFGFQGGLYDPQTKLVRFGARDYDAEIGRWLNRDPIGEWGGINLYGFVGNNPVNFVDPYGLSFWGDFGNGLNSTVSGIGQSMGQGLYDLSHLTWSQNEYNRIGNLMYSLDTPENPAATPYVMGAIGVSAAAATTAAVALGGEVAASRGCFKLSEHVLKDSIGQEGRYWSEIAARNAIRNGPRMANVGGETPIWNTLTTFKYPIGNGGQIVLNPWTRTIVHYLPKW